VFDLIGEPIPAVSGASANLGQVRVNNDRTHLYIGFEQAMIGPNQNIFLFIESPRRDGVGNLAGLGNGKVEFSGEGADGLDFLQNLTFTNFKPSIAAILGDEKADNQARFFARPGFTIRISEGDPPNDTVRIVPFPLGQGMFHLDGNFSDVAGARFQQFNRSPELSHPREWTDANFYETDANFIEVAIPYSAMGDLQPGDEITIGAVVGTSGINSHPLYQHRQLDSTYLGKNLTVDQNVNYRLEGLKVRLSIDLDPDSDGLFTSRELELGTDPNKRDTDGDLLPDGWEVARGLDPLQHGGDAALALDPDADGMSSADELAAGTDPLDGSSYFTLTIDSSADGLRLRWRAIPGATYQVITSDHVSGPYKAYGQARKHEGQAAVGMSLLLDWPLDPDPDKPKKSAAFFRLQLTPKE